MATLTAPCLGFNRLPSPLEKSHNIRNYYALVNVDKFFDLDAWRKTNVRDPKSFGRIPDKIRQSLSESEIFCLINRGVIISAKEVNYDNQNNSISIVLEDDSIHGLIDGGHTYLQIKKLKEDGEGREVVPQIIKIEILTGLDHDAVVDIADGRNTSNQVKEVSLDELNDVFQDIKVALRDQKYANDIAYKEYETYDNNENKAKPISVIEILKCLVALDKDAFTDEKHPNEIVTRDNKALEHFRENKDRLKSLFPLLPDILKLWDTIYEDYHAAYSKAGGHAGKIGEKDSKFFKQIKPRPLHFSEGKAKYSFADSLRLPVFAGFRALLDKDRKGRYSWQRNIDPSDFFKNQVGPKLTRVVCEHLKQTQDVTRTSRTESVWETCYIWVRLALSELK